MFFYIIFQLLQNIRIIFFIYNLVGNCYKSPAVIITGVMWPLYIYNLSPPCHTPSFHFYYLFWGLRIFSGVKNIFVTRLFVIPSIRTGLNFQNLCYTNFQKRKFLCWSLIYYKITWHRWSSLPVINSKLLTFIIIYYYIHTNLLQIKIPMV